MGTPLIRKSDQHRLAGAIQTRADPDARQRVFVTLARQRAFVTLARQRFFVTLARQRFLTLACGRIADLAVQIKSIRKDENDAWDLQGRRKTVPVVQEPGAAVKLTSVGI